MPFPAANLELFRIIQGKNPVPICSKEYLSPRKRGRERGRIFAMVYIDSALIFRDGYFEWGANDAGWNFKIVRNRLEIKN